MLLLLLLSLVKIFIIIFKNTVNVKIFIITFKNTVLNGIETKIWKSSTKGEVKAMGFILSYNVIWSFS